MTVMSGKTGVLGIIGWPVAHSLSPLMQNAALEALGLDYVYVPFPVAPDALGAAVNGLRALGVAGFNVTIPHKEAIIPFLDQLSPEAAASGAVNTVKREGDTFVGYNTDGIGLVRSLQEDVGMELPGAHVLVLGAGGAARGAVAALCAAGVAAITLANRTPVRAEEIVARFRGAYPAVEFASAPLVAHEVNERLAGTDLLLNTTSVGMGGTSFAGLDLGVLRPSGCVYDMVYAPAMTPLLQAAAAHDRKWANGLGMLAAQGEEGFFLWTGLRPPAGLMKGRLLAVLAA